MTNNAKNENGYAIYTIHYNIRRNTIRITLWSSSKTIVTVHNPTADEVRYFVYGTPTSNDVRKTFLS
jgi:hypothetical protein